MKPNHKPLTELDMMMLRAGWPSYGPNDVPGPIDFKHVGSMVQTALSNVAKILHRIASRLEAHPINNQTS